MHVDVVLSVRAAVPSTDLAVRTPVLASAVAAAQDLTVIIEPAITLAHEAFSEAS